MKISEYVSGIEGNFYEDFGAVVQEVGVDGAYWLEAESEPGWQVGIIAAGECPQIDGVTGDKTWVCKVNIATDDEDSLLFECAACRISCVGLGSGTWRPSATIYKVGSTITLPGSTVLDVDTDYYLGVTHELATGDITIRLAGVEDNSVGGSDNVPTINSLPVWVVGAPPSSRVTECAVFSRVLSSEEMPGYVAPPTVTINKAAGQADPANGGAVLFDIVFSEAVTGFTVGDITIGGTATFILPTLTGSGDTYQLECKWFTAAGTVTASIDAGVCTASASGLPNEASTSTDNSVQWDQWVPPVAGYAHLWDLGNLPTLSRTIIGAGPNYVVDQCNNQGSASTVHMISNVAGERPISATSTGLWLGAGFDGGNDWMQAASCAIDGDHTIFVLLDLLSGGSGDDVILEHTADWLPNNGLIIYYTQSTHTITYAIARGGNKSSYSYSPGNLIGQNVLLTFRADGTHANQAAWLNGSPLSGTSGGAGFNSNIGTGTTTSALNWCSRNKTSLNLKCENAVALIYNTTLNNTDRASVEASMLAGAGI